MVMKEKFKYSKPAVDLIAVNMECNVCSYEYPGSTINDITEKDLSGGWQ